MFYRNRRTAMAVAAIFLAVRLASPLFSITATGTETESAAQLPGDGEEIPEGFTITFEEDPESLVPIENGSEDTDNDDLFAAYVNQELGLTGDLKMDAGDAEISTPRQNRNFASTNLSGNNLTVYALLLRQIQEVAAGERTDTVFTVTPKDLGLEGASWSASDLGVDAIVVDKAITSDAKSALTDVIGISYSLVNRALLADCPYELYWYDKTTTSTSKGFSYSARYVNGEYRLYLSGDKTFSMPVAAEYSASGEEATFEANASVGTSVHTARETALSIVNQYADKTDYEKLDAYRKEICDLVSYNYDAAGNDDMSYGNPWQLIWVFDQDPDTNVVCEGYSKGFQYLCDLSSFNSIYSECLSVYGTMRGGAHMWNIVILRDGRSYMADITNSDVGTIGSESGQPGRKLFLVGTGSATDSAIYAQGSVENGYSFKKLSGLTYVYDERVRTCFGDVVLTLADGRVDASTTADGAYSGDHSHIFLPVEEEAADCLHEGHSACGQCVICGEYDEDFVIYPITDHAPGIWTVTTEPTSNEEGTETSCCTVCGTVLTRTIPKLVFITSLTLDKSRIDLACGKTERLTATILPVDATDRTVAWTSSNASVAAVDEYGTVTARTYGTAVITAAAANGMEAACTVQTRFKDVINAGKSCYVPVYWAVDRGITVVTVSFRPEDPVTRGEFVAFLWRLAGKPKSTAQMSFTDVDSSTKFYDAIRWAVGKGIIKGYGDKTFRSENNVTRGETAIMIWRYAGETAPAATKNPFSDLKASAADSFKAILWGAENGIIKGSGGKFLKNDGCTRGQVVTFLYRYDKLFD